MGFYRATCTGSPSTRVGTGFYRSGLHISDAYLIKKDSLSFDVTRVLENMNAITSTVISESNSPEIALWHGSIRTNATNQVYVNMDASRLFYNCQRQYISGLLNFSRVVNADYMFNNCSELIGGTSKVLSDLSYNCTNCYALFERCRLLNEPITIPSKVINASSMLRRCDSFNSRVVFSNNVKNAYSMFQDCTSFNQPITIGRNVEDAGFMFYRCPEFNQPITFFQGIKNCEGAFSYSQNFNSPVTFPNSVENFWETFCQDENFNQPVVFVNSVNNHSIYFGRTFCGCSKFNQPVVIPNGATQCDQMFYNCQAFNQPVVVPNSAGYCYLMFSNCFNLNSSVVLSNNTTSCSRMFYNCFKFNQEVRIPSSVTTASEMFGNCLNFGNNIHVNSLINANALSSLLRNTNNLKRKNVFCKNLRKLNGTTSGTNSIVGNNITWTSITNGYYNSAYNIYIFSNTTY